LNDGLAAVLGLFLLVEDFNHRYWFHAQSPFGTKIKLLGKESLSIESYPACRTTV